MRRSIAAGAVGVALGGLRDLDRLAVARGEPALVGDRDPLDRGLGRLASGRERVGGGLARPDGHLAVALELEHGGAAALGGGDHARGRARRVASSRHARAASVSAPASWQHVA